MIDDTFKQVTSLLFQGGSYTTKELSQKFDVTQKSIQNYMKKLKHTGLKKVGTRYSIPNEFRNIEIYESVNVSTALMIALYKQAIPELKESLTYNFKELPKELDAFVFDINFQSIDNEPLFNQIVSNIMKKLAISFNYTNKRNIISCKNVYPLKVSNLQGFWYLIAYDLEDEKIKTFYIQNIKDLTPFDESFLDAELMENLKEVSASITSPWFNSHTKIVTLKATQDAILYLKRTEDKNLQIMQESESELLIKMSYHEDIEVLNYVKRWLPFITIVDDEVLKQKLQDILTTSLQNYTK